VLPRRGTSRVVALGLVMLAVGAAGVYVALRRDQPTLHFFCRPVGVISGSPEAALSGPTPEAAIRATVAADHIPSAAERLELVDAGGAEQQWLDRSDGRTYSVAPAGDHYRVSMYGEACDARRG
jgi:hypothetical protein